MTIAIAGNRDLQPPISFIEDILSWHGLWLKDLVVATGDAEGVDEVAQHMAAINRVDTIMYKADWDKYGKAAGPIRNRTMIEKSDIVILIWDGKIRGNNGKGSLNVKKLAGELNKPLLEYVVPRPILPAGKLVESYAVQ